MSETKASLLQTVIQELQRDLDVLRKAALETHRASTSDESKAEGKYDTRGLEASYLAEAQAAKVVHLEENIAKLQQLSTDDVDDDAPVAPGTMLIASSDTDELCYIMLPIGGGISLHYQGLDFTVITPESPIGAALIGKTVGQTATLPNHGQVFLTDLW